MSDLLTPHETKAEAYFCPSCGAPVEVPTVLFGGPTPVICSACSWTGAHVQLAAYPFKHGFADDDAIVEAMATDLRNVLAKTAAQTYGSFLLKWGFLDQPIRAEQLGAYISAISRAVLKTVIETRRVIVEEKARERIRKSE